MTNKLITEVIGMIGLVAPASQAVGSVTSGPFILDQLRKHVYSLIVGSVGAAGTATLKLQSSVNGTTGWTDIPGATTTVAASNGVASIEVRADRLNALGQGNYVQPVITVAGNAVLTSLLVQGGDARYMFASDFNATGVAAPVVI